MATATAEIYTLSLHDALPICPCCCRAPACQARPGRRPWPSWRRRPRSEEHTSELQSQSNLVCRLLLEKKKCILMPSIRKTNSSFGIDPDQTSGEGHGAAPSPP